MDKIVEMMNGIRKLKPYIPNSSKNNLFTVNMYFLIGAASISISTVISATWKADFFQLSVFSNSVILLLLIAVDCLAIISLFIFIFYSIFEFFHRLYNGKDIGYFSDKAFLYDLKNIKDLDKKYKEDILQFALTWINSVVKRYEERIKVFGTIFSISFLMVVISFLSKTHCKNRVREMGCDFLYHKPS